MAPQVNSEFNSYLTQAQNLFGQISAAGGSSSSSTYINSCFTVGNNIEQISSGDDQQKASGIQSLIKTAMSLIDKLSSSEAKAADAEVKRNRQAASQLQEEQKKAETQLNAEIQNIEGEIEAQSKIVTDATEKLDDAAEALEEKQEQINEVIQQIQAKQAELANASTPEEQAAILAEIQGLSGQITEITASIADIQSVVETASSEVEGAVKTIEEAKGNAVEVQENGEMKITEIAQNGAAQVQNNAQSNAAGVTNKITGEGAQKAAEAGSSNIFTAGEAAKLYRVAADQNAAGSTRTTGAVTNLQTVMQGIGGLNNNAALLSNFQTSIGNALSDFSGYTGDWNTALEPVITSIGSFTGEGGIQETNTELQEAVTTDLGTLGYSVNNEGEAEQTQEGEKSKTEAQAELLTPNVELKEFEIKD